MVYVVKRIEYPHIRRVMISPYDYDEGDKVYPKRWEDEFPKGGNCNCWKVLLRMPHAWRYSEDFESICNALRELNMECFNYCGSLGDV